MKIINYECENCGGIVEFHPKEKRWLCGYCKKNYFDEIKIFNEEKEEIKLSILECPNCSYQQNKIFGENETIKCVNCEQDLLEKETIIVNGIMKKQLTNKMVQELIDDELNSMSTSDTLVPDEFFKKQYQNEYKECEVYNGIIKLSTDNNGKKIIRKYVFFDLIMLHDDKVNYNNKYIIATQSLDFKSVVTSKEKMTNSLISEKIKVSKTSKTLIKKELENACITQFLKDYRNIERKNVKVEHFLEENKKILIPFYTATIDYNDKKYYNAVSTIKPFSKKYSLTCCFEMPKKEKLSLEKTKLKYKIYNIIQLVFYIITVFVITVFSIKTSIEEILALLLELFFITTIFFLANFFIKNNYLSKMKYIKYQQSMTKDEYYEKLLTENNCNVKYIDFEVEKNGKRNKI